MIIGVVIGVYASLIQEGYFNPSHFLYYTIQSNIEIGIISLITIIIFSGKFMESFDEYTTDQFILRDNFRNIKANIMLVVIQTINTVFAPMLSPLQVLKQDTTLKNL